MLQSMTADDELGQRIEKLRNILVSDAFNRKKKVRVLRRVMELREEPRVCALIREATRLPVNEPMLADFVRALGYLNEPAVMEDLAGYLAHPRKLVARNAVKAAVSYDPVGAVEMVLRGLRTTPVKNLSAGMIVLAERCPRVAAPAVQKLAGSRSKRERLLAIIFLTHAADVEAADLLLDILETERESALIELALQALERQASQANHARIGELYTKLMTRAERLGALLPRLPEKPQRPTPPHSPSRKLLPIRAPVSAESSPELLRVQRPAPPPDPEPPATASQARKLLPWQEKEAKIKARRDEASTPDDAPAGRPWWQPVVVFGVVAIFGVTLLSFVHRPQAQANKRVTDVTTSPLGTVNSKVNFVATIAEVHADYNTLLVRSKDGLLASVRFGSSIATFAPGKSVEIAGTIREIRGGGVCVLDGITARQL